MATVSAGVCAESATGSATVAAMSNRMIRVIVYFFCVGGVPVRAAVAALLAAAPDCAFAFDPVVEPLLAPDGAVRPPLLPVPDVPVVPAPAGRP